VLDIPRSYPFGEEEEATGVRQRARRTLQAGSGVRVIFRRQTCFLKRPSGNHRRHLGEELVRRARCQRTQDEAE
jgi:hypothetical protein